MNDTERQDTETHFFVQVAGHEKTIEILKDKTKLQKKTFKIEKRFYATAPVELREFMPFCYNSEEEDEDDTSDTCLLVLENILHPFICASMGHTWTRTPTHQHTLGRAHQYTPTHTTAHHSNTLSILDLKLGKTLYDPILATPAKRAKMAKKARESTSASHALRIAGKWDATCDMH